MRGGKVVKVIAALLEHLPAEYDYRVLIIRQVIYARLYEISAEPGT